MLAGDVGGTKTQLALFDWDLGRGGGGVATDARFAPGPILGFDLFPSQKARGLAEIAREFAARFPQKPEVACFGVAGPVVNGRVRAPNIPWEVDANEMREALGVREVVLLNDLEACAYGVLCLSGEQRVTLQGGEPRAGAPIAVIAAGTGLGEGGLASAGGRYVALPSEGGHADFAPIGDAQIELLRFVAKTEGHVSYERILAGPGLARIYQQSLESSGAAEPPEVARRAAALGDRSAAIGALAIEGRDPLAVAALRSFARIYGAEAGNLALRSLAYGGVFVAGGIAPKILPFLTDGGFLEAFRAKGRMAPLMPRFPVHVVLEPRTPLIGAALVGASS